MSLPQKTVKKSMYKHYPL